MLKLTKLFKKIDGFGLAPKFLVKGEETYTTMVGALGSLASLTLVGIYSVYLM